MRDLARFLLASLALVSAALCSPMAGYVESGTCTRCHRLIADSYQRTGMGRSFYAVGADSQAFTYDHGASEQHFTMFRRDGRLYQKRYQIGPDSRETNVVEMEAQYVMGSGNHVRTFLHLGADGQLVELPVAWYREGGGMPAMNPGYEGADHMDFRRKIDRECFFCHNAYPDSDGEGPELTFRSTIPEGIDCQRCHGPGRTHVEKATAGAAAAIVRAAIVNPRRLPGDRQIEVCLQCHLESTSQKLPYAIRRYGRGFFSYRPGEPLAEYILHFDRAGPEERFEINSAGYRLLQSPCFRKSAGALTCITCHNPHQRSDGEEALRVYNRACAGCHANAHNAGHNCIECHMPKRRTDDVVHAIMTDHAIRIAEPKSTPGKEVVALYPRVAPELYLAVAQVTDGSNLAAGIPRLRTAIEQLQPREAEFYSELAGAYSRAGQPRNALPYYEAALRRKPTLTAARRGYAQALIAVGRVADAIAALTPASDSASLNALGSAYLTLRTPQLAADPLRRALRIDPDLSEAWINLGNALAGTRNQAGAVDALRNAIRLRPGSAAAHNNLATLLDAQGEFGSARYHFEQAIRIDPADAVTHYNYGRALAAQKLYADAEAHLSEALRLNPRMAEAAVSLGMTLERRGETERAMDAYRYAVREQPILMAAHFNLALALLRRGEKAEAKQHFEIVVRATPRDFEARLHLGEILLDERRYDSAIINLQAASLSPKPEVRTAAHKALQAAQSGRQNLQVSPK